MNTIYYYAVKDKVAEEFGPLYGAKNDNVAIRNFKQLIDKTITPDDYELWYIGTFDYVDGSFTDISQHKIECEVC